MNEIEVLGNNIKTIREERGVSQDELTQYLGVSRQTLIRWEKGLSEPSLIFIYKIADFFDLDIAEFLKVKDNKNKEVYKKPRVIFGDQFLLKLFCILSYETLFILGVVGMCILTFIVDSYLFEDILLIFWIFVGINAFVCVVLSIILLISFIKKKKEEKN